MILDEKIIERYKNDPEGLAEFSFQSFFANKIVSYPVNPFEVLETLGIPFVFRNFKSLEGLVLADKEKGDMLVAINAKRPVQRQRYSCAHELCHIIKGSVWSICFVCQWFCFDRSHSLSLLL